MSYATNADHRSQDHTGTQVRIAAQGPQAANVVGVIDQTDFFRLMNRALPFTGLAPPRGGRIRQVGGCTCPQFEHVQPGPRR